MEKGRVEAFSDGVIAIEPSIVLIEDPERKASGPIWVRGGVRFTSADGFVYERRNRVTLCRCCQSANKPFCDGAHAHIGFRVHTTPNRVAP